MVGVVSAISTIQIPQNQDTLSLIAYELYERCPERSTLAVKLWNHTQNAFRYSYCFFVVFLQQTKETSGIVWRYCPAWEANLWTFRLGGEQTCFAFSIFCAQIPFGIPATLFHVFHVFISSMQVLGCYLKLYHDRSLPHPFHLTTRWSYAIQSKKLTVARTINIHVFIIG
jgi:hypothetical protein